MIAECTQFVGQLLAVFRKSEYQAYFPSLNSEWVRLITEFQNTGGQEIRTKAGRAEQRVDASLNYQPFPLPMQQAVYNLIGLCESRGDGKLFGVVRKMPSGFSSLEVLQSLPTHEILRRVNKKGPSGFIVDIG